MNHTALQKQLDEQRSVVQAVLQGYLQKHACPCAWPQFMQRDLLNEAKEELRP